MKKACVVGCGCIGAVHMSILGGMGALYAVCDVDENKLKLAAEKYKTIITFSDFNDAMNDKNIEVVHICTPHYLHFEMIKAAAAAGKRVVCEKPLVMKESEFDALLSEYADAEILPILQNRTNQSVREMKRIIETDSGLGRPIGAKGILTWHRTADYYVSAAWRGTKAYEGGGVLINQAVHLLDLMIYTCGEVEAVSAEAANNSLRGIIETEDTIDARLRFKNGTAGIFYATNAYCEDSPFQMELKFENAVLSYCKNSLYRDDKLICGDSDEFIGKKYWGSGHGRVISDYYNSNIGLRPIDIQNTMYTMFAIYKSAANASALTEVRTFARKEGEKQ